MTNRRKTYKKASLNLNQQLTVRTAHTCVHSIVHYCSSEQFW